ncbi:MAG: hypothetical protein ACRD4E_08865, partial [Bryobacteraceae bacterium]
METNLRVNAGFVIGENFVGGAGAFLSSAFHIALEVDRAMLPAATSGWAQAYGYDIYGNRWVTSPSPPSLETPTGPSAYLSNNRINGWGYDSAGNILSIANVTRSFTYDAENRQQTATINSIVTTYAYDGEGRRITKTNQGVTTTFVYDAMGNLAAEYGGVAAPADESGTRYL